VAVTFTVGGNRSPGGKSTHKKCYIKSIPKEMMTTMKYLRLLDKTKILASIVYGRLSLKRFNSYENFYDRS